MPPLRCRWLADGVLVAEQTHLVDGFCIWYGFYPVHPHEVFRCLRGGSIHFEEHEKQMRSLAEAENEGKLPANKSPLHY